MKYNYSGPSLLADNCNLLLTDVGDTIQVTDSIAPPDGTLEFVKDIRLNLKVMDPTYDVEMVYNYLGTASYLAEKNWRHDIDKTGRFVELLNMGYLPILMVPSFVNNMDVTLWNVIAQRLKLNVIRTIPYRPDGSRVDSNVQDMFISKIQVKELFGIPYRDMNSQDVLSKLMDKFMKEAS